MDTEQSRQDRITRSFHGPDPRQNGGLARMNADRTKRSLGLKETSREYGCSRRDTDTSSQDTITRSAALRLIRVHPR
jgi:hypothetical protein